MAREDPSAPSAESEVPRRAEAARNRSRPILFAARMSHGPAPQRVDRWLALLLLVPTDGPRWILSELAPSDGRLIEVPGDPIPLPADIDGDGVRELLLVEAPGDESPGRLRVVSAITGATIIEHAIPVQWGRHFYTLPLPDLDRGGEAETALTFKQDDAPTVRTIALLDGEEGGLTFLMTNPPGHERLGFELGAGKDIDGDGIGDLRATTRHAKQAGQDKRHHWAEWVISSADGALLSRLEHEPEHDLPMLFGPTSWTLDVDLDGLDERWR